MVFLSLTDDRDVFHRVDGKLRADHPAESTVHTRRLMHSLRGVIALFVETGTEFQHILWTVFNAETAAFAALINHNNTTVRP